METFYAMKRRHDISQVLLTNRHVVGTGTGFCAADCVPHENQTA